MQHRRTGTVSAFARFSYIFSISPSIFYSLADPTDPMLQGPSSEHRPTSHCLHAHAHTPNDQTKIPSFHGVPSFTTSVQPRYQLATAAAVVAAAAAAARRRPARGGRVRRSARGDRPRGVGSHRRGRPLLPAASAVVVVPLAG